MSNIHPIPSCSAIRQYVHWTGLALITSFCLAVSSLVGAVEVGDEVQFVRAGQTFSGKVVGVRPGGTFLEVETTAGGTTRKLIVKASSVTPVNQPQGRPMRTWSDSTGRFQIEASLESQTAFEVNLRKKDGTTVTVSLDKLSLADQEYVAGLDSSESENPFEAGVMNSAGSSATAQPGGTAGNALALPAPIVFGKGSPVPLQVMSTPSKFAADPSELDFSDISSASMNLPTAAEREDVGRPLVMTATGTDLCYSSRSPRNAPQPYTRIITINGEERTTKELARLAGHSVWLCAANPQSGDVLGAVMKPGDDKSLSLCVISGMSEGNPRCVAHWRMFPGDDKKVDYVRYRKLVPGQMALAVFGGQLHAYDYGARREIWTVPSKMFNEPAVTPGGRYTAIVVDQQCAILETKTGKQVGSIQVESPGPTALGFSADGTHLALATGSKVRVVEVASGEDTLTHEANVPLGGMGKPVLWLTDDFLLLPTGHLLSLKRNLLVWRYMIDQDAMEFADLEHHALLVFTGRGMTSIVRLPHKAATAAADRDTSNIAAVKSGDSLSIMANGSGPGVTATDLRKWLADAAAKSEYRVASSARTQLVATITRGKKQTQRYHVFGRGFATEEVSFTPYISKIEIQQNGKTLWQQSRQSSLPFMLHGEKSLKQVARESERPDAKFFQACILPRQVLKPEFQNGFGNSRVSATGVVDLNR